MYFKNFLQLRTFLSQTLVIFALITWKYLASLIFVLILFFWSGGIIVLHLGAEIQMNGAKSQKLRE